MFSQLSPKFFLRANITRWLVHMSWASRREGATRIYSYSSTYIYIYNLLFGIEIKASKNEDGRRVSLSVQGNALMLRLEIIYAHITRSPLRFSFFNLS